MLTFNYHTHTYRCGHAVGTAEEYIQKAIEGGFEILGMSEHMGFKGWDDPNERIPFLEMEDYEKELEELKRVYSDEIKILSGYEAEYFKDSLDHYKRSLERVDYLILGQHALDRSNETYLHFVANDDAILRMRDLVTEGMESGFFSMVAHPDYFMQARDSFSKACEEVLETLSQASKELDIPLEINLKGYLSPEIEIDGEKQIAYPNKRSLEIFEKVKNPVVLGYDAHNPEDLKSREGEKVIKGTLEKFNLNLVKEPFIFQK